MNRLFFPAFAEVFSSSFPASLVERPSLEELFYHDKDRPSRSSSFACVSEGQVFFSSSSPWTKEVKNSTKTKTALSAWSSWRGKRKKEEDCRQYSKWRAEYTSDNWLKSLEVSSDELEGLWAGFQPSREESRERERQRARRTT